MEACEGQGGISAKIICDSLSPSGVRLTTLELNYHRYIHSEFMTHRMLSRNASSSRAVPIQKNIEQVMTDCAMPISWGKNQAGMQAREECNAKVSLDWDYYNDCEVVGSREDAWKEAAGNAASTARSFEYAGYHKQVVNRLLEPFQFIKVIVTATEWDNFFSLRLHVDAQPEIALLASKMREAMEGSTPEPLQPGEWHLPYVTTTRKEYDNSQEFWSEGYDTAGLSEQEAINCSVARCARVSYMNHDASFPNWEKDQELAKRLLASGHMSPFEHQATPMDSVGERWYDASLWQEGITHLDNEQHFWSGNFRGFLQHRQML